MLFNCFVCRFAKILDWLTMCLCWRSHWNNLYTEWRQCWHSTTARRHSGWESSKIGICRWELFGGNYKQGKDGAHLTPTAVTLPLCVGSIERLHSTWPYYSCNKHSRKHFVRFSRSCISAGLSHSVPHTKGVSSSCSQQVGTGTLPLLRAKNLQKEEVTPLEHLLHSCLRVNGNPFWPFSSSYTLKAGQPAQSLLFTANLFIWGSNKTPSSVPPQHASAASHPLNTHLCYT